MDPSPSNPEGVKMASAIAEDPNSWRTPAFRQCMIAKLEENIQKYQFKPPIGRNQNAGDIENYLFKKAKTKDDYLGFLAKLILHISQASAKKAAEASGQEASNDNVEAQPGIPNPVGAFQEPTHEDSDASTSDTSASEISTSDTIASDTTATEEASGSSESGSIQSTPESVSPPPPPFIPYENPNLWRTPIFRQCMVAKIEENIQKFQTNMGESAKEMEIYIFNEARNKEDYLDRLARLILHICQLSTVTPHNKKEKMATEDADLWKTFIFRQHMIAKIEENVKKYNFKIPTGQDASDIENHLFMQAKTKKEYLHLYASLIVRFSEMNDKKPGGA